MLDFLSEEAINDAYVVASYLSDADLLLAGLRGMITKSYEAESLLQPAAASVAARGVLFGNSHPLPSRSSLFTVFSNSPFVFLSFLVTIVVVIVTATVYF